MNQKLNKLLSHIALELQSNPSQEEIALHQDALVTPELTELNLQDLLKQLVVKGVVEQEQIKYTANRTQSSHPIKATYTSAPSDIYNRLTYILRLNKTKLNQIAPSQFFYDDALIVVGTHAIKLPRYKNEHYFAKAIFIEPINKAVDWSVIYEVMTGDTNPNNVAKAKRSVYDAYEKINKRLKSVGVTGLFIWQTRTVIRTR